jgi:transmembrane sensor
MQFQLVFLSKYLTGAALVLAIFAAGCGKAAEQSVITQTGEQREVKLPNGAVAALNAQSSLAFSASTWSVKPEVELSGEAFFKVPKNKRFFINTRQGQLEAVTGNFNVYARDQLLEVQCVKGRVQVISPENSEKVLLANSEQVSVQNGWMQERRGLSYCPAWFNGRSMFRDAPLARVLGEIGRQYGKVIVEADSLSGNFTGQFDHKNLDRALAAVCQKAKLTYSVSGDTVRVGR